MKVLTDLFFRLAEFTLVTMLCLMVIMVFGNVVLRYGFNDGIISSEELSRYLFIWITFLGAIVTMRDNAHLGLDSLVRRLSLRGKKLAYAISNILMLGCCALMFYGTFKQHGINASTRSPVLEIPMIWIYGVGYLTSVAMGLMIAAKLVALARGQFQESDLIQIQDSEETAISHAKETPK
ncbi:MAG: 2,3-diketo-L-gulonate transporter small permease protein YiaM [Pseudomonadota bacterium]|jgi:TRAP-type C4-dicarboxylate transport system permease small subunit